MSEETLVYKIYAFILGPKNYPYIQRYLDEGVLPSITALYPALYYTFFLSIARLILHYILFKVIYIKQLIRLLAL